MRDTWEISAAALRFETSQWPGLLEKALQRISRDLGLASSGSLRAELHNLLVYGPGQFFATHQDSEKHDNMIGTLVITLPSEFTGGEFIVSHQGEEIESRGSENRLGFMAFYADCAHEVRPVKQGYRVVLTYNLLMPTHIKTPEPSSETVTALTRAITAFWQTPATNRWGSGRPAQTPDRLVYLLDHEYTQASLSWKRLKGADATRVGALRKIADTLDAEIFLALADIQETWTTEDDYPGYSDWGYHYYEDHDETGGRNTSDSDPALGELIDDQIELRHWITPDGSLADIQDAHVDDAELCYTLATKDCTPFESEYEGYTGNAGSTIDRWYHRAAVIMWPRTRGFAVRAHKAPGWAIEQIATALRENQNDQARQWVAALLPYWPEAARRQTTPFHNDSTFDAKNSLLDPTMQVAANINNPSTAEQLLDPFMLTDLHPTSAPWFARLLEHYGPDWCQERLRRWRQNARYPSLQEKQSWLANTIFPLTQAMTRTGFDSARPMLASLLQDCWASFRTDFDHIQGYEPIWREQDDMAEPAAAVLALLEASSLARQLQLEQEIIEALQSSAWPFSLALGVLHAAASRKSESRKRLSGVHKHCMNVLAARLQQPARKPDDWSMDPPRGCDPTLAVFLRNPTQRRLEWPLAKPGRQIIHQFIDAHELPVTHETRRTGRPFTLVLEKTSKLFKHEANERSRWKTEVSWLHQAENNFSQDQMG
ncbi:MAG: 2OG-Fe(II) oxygenase [Alcaligenaceae bacterium]|nr:2OG-Fe(II) oxygenase [Alcaligenaceae bacterium]